MCSCHPAGVHPAPEVEAALAWLTNAWPTGALRPGTLRSKGFKSREGPELRCHGHRKGPPTHTLPHIPVPGPPCDLSAPFLWEIWGKKPQDLGA